MGWCLGHYLSYIADKMFVGFINYNDLESKIIKSSELHSIMNYVYNVNVSICLSRLQTEKF